MDFQTLNRRQLQALCKLNKIHANITNIAMADALSSLNTVEGIEEFLNSSRTESVGLSIKSPPLKKAKIDHNKVLKTPLVSCTTKKRYPETSSCHLCATNSQMNLTKSILKETVQKETPIVEADHNTRRSTRLAAKRYQRTFGTSKEDSGKPLQEKQDAVVLGESDENSKIEKAVHVDTITLENGEKKVDCCDDVDNLKVKLEKLFGQLEDMDLEERHNGGEKFGNFEEKSSQVDNLENLNSEDIHDPNEPMKLDNHNAAEIMNAEGIEENTSENTVDFVNPEKQNASINSEVRGEEPQESLIEVEEDQQLLNHSRSAPAGLSAESCERIKIKQVLKTPLSSCTREEALTPSSCHDVASQLVECEDIASLVTAKESLKVDSFSDETSTIEKVVHVDMTTVEAEKEKADCGDDVDNLKVKSVQIIAQIEDVNLEETDTVEVTHDKSIADVSFLEEEENQKFPTNENDDVVIEENKENSERESEVVVTEESNEKEGKSSLHGNSLRQLKKRLKETLINSPVSVRIKTEGSDDKEKSDMKKPQVEENEKEKANKRCSLRQLRKQVKEAISVKYSMR